MVQRGMGQLQLSPIDAAKPDRNLARAAGQSYITIAVMLAIVVVAGADANACRYVGPPLVVPLVPHHFLSLKMQSFDFVGLNTPCGLSVTRVPNKSENEQVPTAAFLEMTETTLSAPGILALAFAFALAGLMAYSFGITHPEAEQLVRWAQMPISTLTR
jgi:hypothetical protein